MDKIKTLYHGSKNIIPKPEYGLGKPYNDYGLAFYCTESDELAREWAVARDRDGFVNQYQLDMNNLSVLNLNADDYTILHWLAILLDNRTFDVQSDFGEEAVAYLRAHFLVDYDRYDVIIGYRADDSYFTFAQDFLNNVISLRTLSRAMYLGRLGEQVALKSKRAFSQLVFEGQKTVERMKWYPRKELRDQRAREEYARLRAGKWKRGETYIMQIIDEEMKSDDARLRPKFIE